jgi:hypothetical protein
MPPKFKPGDTVLFNAFGAHKPEAGNTGSIHVVAAVLPFTLGTGQVVNAPHLGRCTVIRVHDGSNVKVRRHKDSTEHFIKLTDVDDPPGKPIPNYELKRRADGDLLQQRIAFLEHGLGDTFWAPEDTLTLVEAAHKPGPERRSMRNQSATKSWSNF